MDKYCNKCGNKVLPQEKFCTKCGNGIFDKKLHIDKENSFAKAGFIVSLISIFTCGLTAFVSLVLSIIGIVTCDKSDEKGKKHAFIGLVISVIFLGIFCMIAVLVPSSDLDSTNSSNPTIDNQSKKEEKTVINHNESNESKIIKKDNKSKKKKHVETKEEYISKCVDISYEELSRNPKQHEGSHIKFRGKVLQVSKGLFNNIHMRIEVTEGDYGIWKDVVYVDYKYKDDNESKILENDIVYFYGKFKGEKTYTSVLGASITVPDVDAKYIDRE